jgi:hypothetical protein
MTGDRSKTAIRDVGLLPYITWRWRWYRWFFDGPNIAKLVNAGWDNSSRALIYNRHYAREPAPPPLRSRTRH